MSINIKSMQVRLFHVPLESILIDSLHGTHTHFDLITVTLTSEEGIEGTGYTYTGGRGGNAIYTMIDKDLRQYVINQTVESPRELKSKLEKTFHYVGRGGVLEFGISAIDIALWDIFTKQAGKTLYEYICHKRKPIKTYYGGIDLGYTKDELVSSIKAQLERGHNAAKIKVGKDDYREDIERIKAVREVLGNDKILMIDANMVWDLETAKIMAREVKKFDITWIEEPMNPDKILSYRELSEASEIPIAMGENLHLYLEHKNAIDIGKITYPEPDASNVGGITGWLEVADLAKSNGLVVSSHGMQELHLGLLSSVDNDGYMEYHSFPIDKYTTYPLVVTDGKVMPNDEPGPGVTFDWNKLMPYEVK